MTYCASPSAPPSLHPARAHPAMKQTEAVQREQAQEWNARALLSHHWNRFNVFRVFAEVIKKVLESTNHPEGPTAEGQQQSSQPAEGQQQTSQPAEGQQQTSQPAGGKSITKFRSLESNIWLGLVIGIILGVLVGPTVRVNVVEPPVDWAWSLYSSVPEPAATPPLKVTASKVLSSRVTAPSRSPQTTTSKAPYQRPLLKAALVFGPSFRGAQCPHLACVGEEEALR